MKGQCIMTTSKNTTEITIPAINIQFITLKIVGDTPLIVHKWSEKAKREILEKQQKKAKTKGYDVCDPVADFVNSIYWLEGEPEEKTEAGFEAAIKSGKARFGFPSIGLKAAATSAGYRSEVTKNIVSINAKFHILGDYIEIDGIPEMREDMVTVQSGGADLRYRGEFKEWSSTFTVKYNASAISAEQIVNLINLGGFASGIGEWRVEKSGSNGMFHVE